MKKRFLNLMLLCASAIAIIGCKKHETVPSPEPPPPSLTLQELREGYLQDQVQSYSVTANQVNTIYGAQGTTIFLSGNNFVDNSGNPLTGTVDVKLIELYKPSAMILANKQTLANVPGGAEIIGSGGEFWIEITQNGLPVTIVNPINVNTKSITTLNNSMELFSGAVDPDGTIRWTLDNQNPVNGIQDSISQSSYYNFLFDGAYDWVNCDYFWSSSLPQTPVTVSLPSGLNADNCMVMAVVTSENTVSSFYEVSDGVFGTGNGYTLPVGLNAHFVVIAEDGDDLKYAVVESVITTNHAVSVQTLTEVDSMAQLESLLDQQLQ